MDRFMKIAADEALKAVTSGKGGPFGAVIVSKGKVIAKAHNTVTSQNDPTAHAEMNAIRAAAKKLNRFELSDCELYTNCEPCPMCLAAAYWARIGKIHYGCTRRDAKRIGFDDQHFYDLICGKSRNGRIKAVQVSRTECLKHFKMWESKRDKKRY